MCMCVCTCMFLCMNVHLHCMHLEYRGQCWVSFLLHFDTGCIIDTEAVVDLARLCGIAALWSVPGSY